MATGGFAGAGAMGAQAVSARPMMRTAEGCRMGSPEDVAGDCLSIPLPCGGQLGKS
jgi:hypothetical protein